MRIDVNPSVLSQSISRAPLANGRPVAEREPTAPTTGASVIQISETSSVSGTFDADRVQAIREAIARGEFTVNPEAIAEGLMATVRDMIRSNGRSA